MLKLGANENFKKETIPDVNNSLIVELLNEISTLEKDLREKGLIHKLSDFFDEDKNGDGKIWAKKEVFRKYGESNSKPDEKLPGITEYMGLYIISERNENDIKPTYVGISRKIIQRLKNHAYGPSKDTATLAYLLAFGNNKDKESKYKFNENIDDIAELSKKQVRNLFVYIYPYNKCNYKLQLLEVLVACKLKAYWNSFKTH